MTQTVLYAKAKVLAGMLEEKEDGLSAWKRKLIYDYMEACQKLISEPDRRKDYKVDRRVTHG